MPVKLLGVSINILQLEQPVRISLEAKSYSTHSRLILQEGLQCQRLTAMPT
jgi:hypothetical protein